jgi:DNA-binding transcriptional ArsR family regulator
MEHLRLPHDHGNHSMHVLEHIPEYTDFQTVAELFKQLSDATRVRIFWILCHCEECVLNLSAMMEMSSPAVSHHLRQLRNAELVITRREGKEVYYRAADNEKASTLHSMIETLLAITCPNDECDHACGET